VEQYIFDTPMLLSAIIMILTFIGIFTEGLHGFHRTKFAMLGAGTMIIVGQIYGFYTPDQALEAIDWNVVFLLGAMMTIVSIMLPTGGFEAIAYKIAQLSKGRLFILMTLMGTAVAVISLMLDNVTTVVIFGPIIVLIASALKVNPIPYLLAAALLSDTGGVATLVGDPPNLMIGSAKGIDFNTFFLHMGGIVLAAYIGTIFTLKFLFRKELGIKPEAVEFKQKDYITDRKTWNASLIVLGIMVFFFIFHHALGWDAWMVATFGLTLLLFLAPNTDMDGAFGKIEITLLSFFMALFVIIGGVEHTHFLEYIGSQIEPFVRSDLLMASLILMWGSAVLSAMIDNIPFTAAMIPILMGFEAQGIPATPLWWALAIGVGMGGNGSHLGSTANVFIVTLSERLAKEKNDPSLAITPGLWFRKGTPAMIVTLIISSIIFWMFFDFYAKAI
jgi:Na+/H+ antiporter NhaD/arsenite permease-like protein